MLSSKVEVSNNRLWSLTIGRTHLKIASKSRKASDREAEIAEAVLEGKLGAN